MKIIACMALLLALAGCSDADEYTALSSCKIQRAERAANSSEYEYLTACMWLKGYRRISTAPCNGLYSSNLSSCYKPDGELAAIWRNLAGRKPPF